MAVTPAHVCGGAAFHIHLALLIQHLGHALEGGQIVFHPVSEIETDIGGDLFQVNLDRIAFLRAHLPGQGREGGQTGQPGKQGEEGSESGHVRANTWVGFDSPVWVNVALCD